MYTFLLKNLIMPMADRAMKTKISYFYKKIIKMNKFDRNLIEEWQNEKLQKLIYHAYNNTTYYKKLFDDHKINPSSIKTKSDPKRIPNLTKSIIIENFKDLVPKNIENIPHKNASTGGSTGDPLNYLLDYRSWSFSAANNMVNWEKTSYSYGNKYIALGSTSLFVNEKQSLKHSIYYRLKNRIGLNGINMSDEVCERYVQLIKSKNIKYLYGYASAIYLLARWSHKNNIKLNIDACFTTSEVLTESYKKGIIDSFNCDVVNCYGAHDGGVTAIQVNKGCFKVGYNSLITIKEKDSENVGSVLLTDLLNYAMPFINYELGDELQINKRCDEYSDYNGQAFNRVYGRTSDIVRLENGSVITGPGFATLFHYIPVEGYSIEKTGFNTLTCKMKKIEGFNNHHEQKIRSSLEMQSGDNSIVKLIYVDEFDLTKSGKKRYFFNQ